jgi:hypothetical protein
MGSHKTVEIKIFLFFCLMKEDPGGPKTYGSYGSGTTTLQKWVPAGRVPYRYGRSFSNFLGFLLLMEHLHQF